MKSHGIQPNITNFSLWTFFVNFIPGKSVSDSFQNIIFKIFWGTMPPDPPRTGLKNFSRRWAARTFLPRNLTLNSYNKLANIYCNRFSIIFIYIISDNSLITLMKSGITMKYWFVKNITESFTSFVLCFLNVLLFKQH